MSTPRDNIYILSELLRDTPKELKNKLLVDIKANISKNEPPTKLYCITAILLSGSQNIKLGISRQPQLNIPPTVVVTNEWDIAVNIIAFSSSLKFISFNISFAIFTLPF